MFVTCSPRRLTRRKIGAVKAAQFSFYPVEVLPVFRTGLERCIGRFTKT